MNVAIIVDINTDRNKDEIVIVQQVNRTLDDEIIPTDELNQIELMFALCEATCLLIHSANKEGLKKDFESVKDCINHIQNGFSDASYRVSTQ
ncbi:MAG: hypothetical protein GXO85_02280 [Chlorobi bacterium]|nr:hypothetical protein [Chlorobiota bacterium]